MTLEEVRQKVEEASRLTAQDIQPIVDEAKSNNKIPKIGHFCFYGWRTMPEMYLHFLKTWFEKLPDWTFINWNADNIDHSMNKWMEDKWARKRYAFLADFIRVWAVYNFGGWYFDCDALCHKDISVLEDYDYLFGQECWLEYREHRLSFECGVFGAKPNNHFLQIIVDDYSNNLEEEISPTKYIKLLKQKGIHVVTLKIMNGYKRMIENDKKTIYLLDSKYFSNTNIPGMGENYFKLSPEQYTSHEFTNSWCGGDGARVRKYFGITKVESLLPDDKKTEVSSSYDTKFSPICFGQKVSEIIAKPEGIEKESPQTRIHKYSESQPYNPNMRHGKIRIRRMVV